MVAANEATDPVPAELQLLIVDQQRTFCDALATRLRVEPDLVVVVEAQSTQSALRALAGRSTDVILLDAELPDDSGVAFCAEMRRRVYVSRVVMLSAASDAQRIVAAVRAGAVAWVRKDESIDHLLRVVRGVVRGETWLPPADLGQVLGLLMEDQDDRHGCDESARAADATRAGSPVPPGRGGRAERDRGATATVREHGPHPPAEPHGEAWGSLHARGGGAHPAQAGGIAGDPPIAQVHYAIWG